MLVNQNAVFLPGDMSCINRLWKQYDHVLITRKNNRFPFLDILGCLKNTDKNLKFWKSETSPNQGTWWGIPWLRLVSLCQIWDFYGYNLFKYPKISNKGICYFFLWMLSKNQSAHSPDSHLINFGANSCKLINCRIKPSGQQ